MDIKINLHPQYIIFIKKATNLNLLREGVVMDPKLIRQFIIFMVLLFGWTIVLLLAGPK
jgi:hypothetical protein